MSEWTKSNMALPEQGRLVLAAGMEHDIFLARRGKTEFHTLSGSYRIVDRWMYADDMESVVDSLAEDCKVEKKKCIICGKLFTPIRSTHYTCGPSCSYERQLRASYQRSMELRRGGRKIEGN